MYIDIERTLLTIISKTGHMTFGDIYSEYLLTVGDTASKEMAVRRVLNKLVKTRRVERGKKYIRNKGYLYSIPGTTPVAGSEATQITYGDELYEALEFLQFLLTPEEEHVLIKPELWKGLRTNLALTMLSEVEGHNFDAVAFKYKLSEYRDLLVQHLMQINTLLNSNLWGKPLQQYMATALDNPTALVDRVIQYQQGIIERLD